MNVHVDMKCEKAIPLSDDARQDVISFIFYLENSGAQEYVLINTPNGGFTISREEFNNMFFAINQFHYFSNEEEDEEEDRKKK